MAVLATDNFNRANNADLGVNWDVQNGSGENAWKILNNAAEPSTLASNCGESYNAVTWPDDQYSQVKCSVTGASAGTGPGPSLRCSTIARTYYIIQVSEHATQAISVRKRIAGAATSLGTINTVWVDGDVLKAEIQGSTIKIYQNGTQIGSDITDSAIASGRAGIAYDNISTTASVDDWEGGDFEIVAAEIVLHQAVYRGIEIRR